MTAIKIRELSKRVEGFSMDKVSFAVPKGYISGLIGPNGAGKSTLIKMVMGMAVPDQGSITIHGKRAGIGGAEYRQEIGYVSDENIYYETLTLEQMKEIYRPFYPRWDEQQFREYLDRFELSSKKKIKDCSKGMKTKYALALALSHHPSLLIMDEPTAGLDPVFRRELLDLLSEFIQDENRTVLFSTHLTTDLDKVADYITFIHRGRLVFSETKDEVLERYLIVKGSKELLDSDTRKEFVGLRETDFGFEGLAGDSNRVKSMFGSRALYHQPALEDIMYFTAKGGMQRV